MEPVQAAYTFDVRINWKEIAMNKLLRIAAVAAALGSAGAAYAAATQVNFGFVPFGDINYAGASLGTSTSLDFGDATFVTNTVGIDPPYHDNSGVYTGMPVFLSSAVLSYTIGATTDVDLEKMFTTGPGGAAGSEGLYTVLFSTVVAQSTSADFVNLTFQGTISGPDGFQASDVMLVNCNQSGGQDAAVNCSFTEEGPPIAIEVPEPATLSLVGLSLVGLLVAGRRRNRLG